MSAVRDALVRSLAISRRGALSLFFSTSVARATGDPGGLGVLPPLSSDERRLFLVRHGETDWNVEGRIQGRTDNPLNSNGVAQARALARYLKDEPFDVITSSTLLRARETADAIAVQHLKARRVEPSQVFAEMCFGELEGAKLADIQPKYKSVNVAWRTDSDLSWPGPGGESPNDVAARGMNGLRKLGLLPSAGVSTIPDDAASAPRHVLVVAHGRFNKILLAALQGDITRAGDIQQGNTCINVVDFDSKGGVYVRALNVREHLAMVPSIGESP